MRVTSQNKKILEIYILILIGKIRQKVMVLSMLLITKRLKFLLPYSALSDSLNALKLLIIPRSGKRHLRVQRKTELIADKKDLCSFLIIIVILLDHEFTFLDSIHIC